MNRETQWNRWERQSLQGDASWELFVKRTKIKKKHSFSGTARLPGAGSHPQRRRRSERNALFLICELRSSVLGLWFTDFLGFILTFPPHLTSPTDLKEAHFIPTYNHKYFLGAFAKFLKATSSFAMSDRPHRTSSHWTDFQENLTFARFAENLSKQFKFR